MSYLEQVIYYQQQFQEELQDLRGNHEDRIVRRVSPERIMKYGLACLALDIDSTLITKEGIEMMAALRGEKIHQQIAEMTREAMRIGGNTAEIFIKRLEAINPLIKDLETVGDLCCEALVEDTCETIEICQALGINMHLISGGYDKVVAKLGQLLGIPNIHANAIDFNKEGSCQGLALEIPLWTPQGKPLTIERLISQGRFYSNSAMIGDGGTDAATAVDVDVFIGYGGVTEREDVKEQSPFYIRCKSLSPLAVIAAGQLNWEGIMRHPQYAPLLEKGFDQILAGNVILRGEYQNLVPKIQRFRERKSWEKPLWK